MSNPLDLDTRAGWPVEMLDLLRRHPREGWQAHPNLGATAQFWLRRHAMFRELGAEMAQGTLGFRAGEIKPAPFRRWFAPRLRFFLGELEGHHHIEDAHYFPLFQRAEPKLARGFAVLEGDHDTIHADLLDAAQAGRAFVEALARDRDAALKAGEGYAVVTERLLRRLMRHLDDEEDLVAPLILDRGEAALGL